MTAILVESALRGLLFAAIVGLGLTLFRVRNVPARKAAWTLVLLASVAMPLLIRVPALAAFSARTAWGIPVRIPTMLAAQPVAPASGVAPSHVAPAAGVSVDLLPADSDTFAPAPAMEPAALQHMPANVPAHRSFSWPALRQLISWAYLVVAAALVLRLLIGVLAALRLWATADPVSPLIAPEPNVRASAKILAPVTVGSGIVLPADYSQWDRAKLRMVIAHERSHVRQMDFYLQMLAGVYTALFWFSPLGWWLRRTLSSLGEAIGDRAGMQAAATRSRYAEALLEIAALPHRSLPGVAMARSANLSRRVESLLNDEQMQRAFFEGKRRALASLLIIPAALFAATALVRVPAASAQTTQQAAPPPQTDAQQPKPVTGQSNPPEDQVTDTNPAKPSSPSTPAPPAQPTAPAASGTPAAPASPSAAPAAPPAPAAAPATPDILPAPPADGEGEGIGVGVGQSNSGTATTSTTEHSGSHHSGHTTHGYFYQYGSEGDSYALVTGPGNDMTFSGSWVGDQKAEIDKARQMANGPFLWFRHDGKAYIVTDPAIIAQLQEMTAPMQELGRRQQALGEQQRQLGEQQRAFARQQREAGDIELPDMSKMMADVNAALAQMKANQPQWDAQKWAQVESELKSSQKLTEQQMGEIQGHLAALMAELARQRADVQAKIAAMQGRLGELQGEAGARMGAFGSQMGELGRQMGQLGQQQGRLGQEQGRLARELHEQVQKIIEQSLANGKAKPVQ